MRIRGWWLFAGLALAGATSSPAEADGSWTGPGWYIEESETGFFDETLVSGPYGDEDACNAVKPADDRDYSYFCVYEGTDPTVPEPPRERV